jgi:hypothetical protein
MDMVKDLLLNKTSFNPDNKDLGQMMLVTADDDTGQQMLQTPGEAVQNAAEQGISPEKAIGASIDNLQQKVKEDYEDGTSKIVETKFEDENPSVTWNPDDDSQNTYQQVVNVEGNVTYSINTRILDNTCGAEIDAESGKVTFDKPGKVNVVAVFTDNDGFVFMTSYTLTVKAPPSTISKPDNYDHGDNNPF